ncbi:DUF6600 domain-containing protein [Undibacterium danionis]|uniref:DUF6600 domain-containing protein n=1 Tax=Undibacterium danionis TaxID=1812100 RepID=A0ABV6I999_9BURK
MTLIHHTRKLLSLAAISFATFGLTPAASAQDEPPARVARVGYAYGNINFADAGSNEWVPLLANRPISTGDSVFVPANGRAELQVGANALRMAEQTRISFINLNDDNIQIKLSQGSIVLRVRAMQEKENIEVSTPNLNFSIQEPGEYRINVNDDNTSTIIVRNGIGVAQGDRDIITLRAGEQTRFSGTNLNHTQITRVPPFDTFDQWAADRDRADENSISARYVPREVVGYQQLDDYGIWETHVEYGAIWYPRGISVGWAPYRDGQWVWVAPWGWTWVDRAPWGFAPYHYGRWAFVGKRWGWVPGRYERHYRPVYAPALVAFVGVGSNGISAGINLSSRNHGPSVSWFPLGPGEVYHPHYTQNSRYIQNLNQTVIINNTTVINRPDRGYRNQNVHNAITSVPTRTFVRGEHVFPASSSILSGQIKQMQVATEAPNLVPERGNRFGDARPRNWQENDQFRSRPVMNNSNRGEAMQTTPNTAAPSGTSNGTSNGILGNAFNQRPQDNRGQPNNVQNNAPNNRDNGQGFGRRIDNLERPQAALNSNDARAMTVRNPNQQIAPANNNLNNTNPSSSGIRTLEEMNEQRNRNPRIERLERSDRFDKFDRFDRSDTRSNNNSGLNAGSPSNPIPQQNQQTQQAQQVQQVPQAPAINTQRAESRRESFDRNNAPVNVQDNSAAMQVQRPMERQVERPSRAIMNERSVEQHSERRLERSIERPVERSVERPPAMPQATMPQAPRAEPRPAPEARKEVKAEKEKEGEKRKFER